MYLVKALVDAFAPDITGKDVDWDAGQTGFVPDHLIGQFRQNPAAWTVLAGPDLGDMIAAVPANSPGAAPTVTGLAVADNGVGVVNQTVITLSALEIAVTDTNAYGSQKVYDFPAGRILVLGVTGSIQWAVTSDRTTTINASAGLTWALGSAAASNATLATTMVDLLPKTSKTLSASAAALNTASTGALASSAPFDGTATAIDAYLNVGFETATDIDADGTLTATGTLKITWINLGDY